MTPRPERSGPGRIDWLASYPKSGNTWLRILLANYFAETDDPYDFNMPGVTRGSAASRWVFDEFLGISSSDLSLSETRAMRPQVYKLMAQRNFAPIWLKTHDRQQRVGDGGWLFPAAVSGSAIYIIRNPLDVAVSNAFHDGHTDMARAVNKLCDQNATIGQGSSDQFPQLLGDWSGHVQSWVDQGQIRVLVVRYEDMLADTAAVLTTVIRFARPDIEVERHRVTRAVRNSRIEALQLSEDRTGFREAPRTSGRFFRKGEAGDWRNHLSAAQALQIRVAHLAVMSRFGYVDLT